MKRWWTYQRERFPVFAHGPLVLAFSFCAVSYSGLLRGGDTWPAFSSFAVAFVTALLFFLQLRIADEFKDFEDDSRYRPYRAVPRGLVTLRELGWLGVAAAAIQLGLALWLKPSMVLLLLIPWVYLTLMSKEFFVRRWIVTKPFTYMWTHMMIMPLIDLYATSCDWHVAGEPPPRGLIWFLVTSYFNGLIIEIGRKIRAPGDEEEGVITYSVVWGIRGSTAAWLAAIILTAGFAAMAAHQIGFLLPMTGVLTVLVLLAVTAVVAFVRRPRKQSSKMIEIMSGIWTLLMYLTLGGAPLLFR